MADDLELKFDAMTDISNIANRLVCVPIAQRIMAQLGPGYRISIRDRTHPGGWARTSVATASIEAMRREVRDGALAKAFGAAL